MEGGVLVRVSKPSVFGTEKEPKYTHPDKDNDLYLRTKNGSADFSNGTNWHKIVSLFRGRVSASCPVHTKY